jgi:3-hexulose-6-phosphate synthase
VTHLHYALDVTSEHEALALSELAGEADIGIVEAGSLLVKIAGLSIIPKLRAVLPKATLVADLKTLDMGAAEVAAAAAVGADEVIVAAAASNATVHACVTTAKAEGIRVLATMIGVEDVIRRGREIVDLGVDVVLAHNAVDDANTWLDGDRYAALTNLARELGPAFAISGTLDLPAAEHVLGLRPERLVVGRAITLSNDPRSAFQDWIALVGHGHERATG